ncbi:DNA phosphorothioation-dependent restriction protein DptF [Neobacillus rhizosphaerae]|uniref:DNA phosphorothioation-dependent restriction protein DptF n=1 Tax=Neobacillus rhizosphaerae TaxID=2880965 RepID=UPI003D29E94B
MDFQEDVSLFSFLEKINPTAAINANKMEDLIYEDPSSAIIKARVFAEQILIEVFKQEKIEMPYQSTLYDKISLLTREEYIKRDIQQAFDIIRLSGNKAAHDGNFNDITEAFKLHKEMYKIGVWYLEVYSLEQLKVPPYRIPKPRRKENIENLVEKKIFELLGTGQFDTVKNITSNKPMMSDNDDSQVITKDTSKTESSYVTEDSGILMKNLSPGESYLLRELRRLKDSAQEAIENASQFSKFKDYIHVDRKIQLDLQSVLEQKSAESKGNLILLCGSVGDGKSHLLAYLKEKKNELIKDYTIFNDATESFSPNKNAMETLEDVLKNFSDQRISESNEKIILAINMGVLHNFINTKHSTYTYNNLNEFVEKSGLFTQDITTHYSDNTFDLFSFSDYHSYELTENGPKSSFYSALLEKIFVQSDHNPFHLALKEDEENHIETMMHQNYRLLQNKFVQEQVVQLIIQTIVKKKLVISARAFLNFVADILIPGNLQNVQLLNEFDVLELALPNLLFNRRDRSNILNAMSQLDPIHRRSVFIDQIVIDLNTLNDWNSIIEKNIQIESARELFNSFNSKSNLTGYSFNIFFESFLRIAYLTNKEFNQNLRDSSYLKFVKNLYYFNVGDKRSIRAFYDEIKTAIFKWKGSPKKEYIFINKPSDKYRLAQKLNLKPTIAHLKSSANLELDTFKSSIVLAYHDGNPENTIYLDIDYPLYKLLTNVQQGYRPNKKDKEDAIKFVEFIEKLMSFGEKKKEMLVFFPRDNRFYTIKRDDFDSFVFEKE